MALDPQKLKRTLLTDIKVELTEEFDLNFERKGFFPTSGSLALSLPAVVLCLQSPTSCVVALSRK